MNLSNQCLRNKGHETDSIIVCRDAQAESRSEYRLMNDNRTTVHKYEVDGCLIDSNDLEKCDFLLTVLDAGKKIPVVFVELKGKKFFKAISQINNSIEKLKPDPGQYKVFARIVMSIAPKLQGPEYTKLLEKTLALGGDLKVKSKVISEATADLL